MTASSIFNAYIDANFIIILAALLWIAARFILTRTAFKQAGLMQLQLVYGVLLAVAAAPVVISLHTLAQNMGLFGAEYSASLSDYALAQFLNGRIEMAPLQFEALWMSRTVFAQNVTTLATPVAIVLVGLFSLGFGISLARLLRNAVQVRAVIRSGYQWRRIGRVAIVLSDRMDVPFSTRGVRTRYIVLPSTLLSQSDDLRIAIAHELQHMRQGDLGWEITLELLRPIFFWNPAFLFFKREVEELREVACDQQVLVRRHFGVRDYCDCLLRVCDNAVSQNTAARILVPSVPFVRADRGKHAARSLKRRVLTMMSGTGRAPSRWVTGLMALPFVACISVASVASQSSNEWSQDKLMLSTIVNLERLDQRTFATRY